MPKKLAQIKADEAALDELGFTELRVRHNGEVARIALPLAELSRPVTTSLRKAVQRAVSSAVLRLVALDPSGLQSGAFSLPHIHDQERHDARRHAAQQD